MVEKRDRKQEIEALKKELTLEKQLFMEACQELEFLNQMMINYDIRFEDDLKKEMLANDWKSYLEDKVKKRG